MIQNEANPSRSRLRLILRSLATLAITAGIFIGVIPLFADYGDVWDSIRGMDAGEVAWLILVGAINIVTYWFVLMAVMPGLTLLQAGLANQASTAVANTIPGGGALGVGVSWAMYRSWGFGSADFAQATVLSGVWNNFVKLAMPVVALALVAFTGEAEPELVSGAVLGISLLAGVVVLFVLMLRSERFAFRTGDWAGRTVTAIRSWFGRDPVSGWGAAAAGFFARATDLIRRRWAAISLVTVLSHVALYLLLLVCLRLLGITEGQVGWIVVLASFALVRLASAVPITPGGVGLVELGFVALLGVGLDEAARAQVIAAVLLFRAVAFVVPVPLGLLGFLYWRAESSRYRPEPVAEAGESVSP
jgi:uncharacterized membrane protein YbhN (UPF0104 family)